MRLAAARPVEHELPGALARRPDIRLVDALSVELADRLNAPLITTDARGARAQRPSEVAGRMDAVCDSAVGRRGLGYVCRPLIVGGSVLRLARDADPSGDEQRQQRADPQYRHGYGQRGDDALGEGLR